MWNRRWIFAAALVACGLVTVQVAAPLLAQQKDNAPASADASNAERDLDVAYAQAYLRLMEATLNKYQETNRKQPNTIRRGVITAIEENVRNARERVTLAEGDNTSDAALYVSSRSRSARCKNRSARPTQPTRSDPAPSANRKSTASRRISTWPRCAWKGRDIWPPNRRCRTCDFEIEQLREDVQELRLIVALLAIVIRASGKSLPPGECVAPHRWVTGETPRNKRRAASHPSWRHRPSLAYDLRPFALLALTVSLEQLESL